MNAKLLKAFLNKTHPPEERGRFVHQQPPYWFCAWVRRVIFDCDKEVEFQSATNIVWF